MTELFVASDGTTVWRGCQFWEIGKLNLSDKTMDTLREYFQAKQDKELGRWRDPEYPDIFARPFSNSSSIVGVVKDDEEGLAYGQFKRGDYPSLDPMSIVAYRYFTEHPEKKPWHDAKPGEVWVLTYDCEEVVATLEKNGSWKRFDGEFESSGDLRYVKSAHRIWPENKES